MSLFMYKNTNENLQNLYLKKVENLKKNIENFITELLLSKNNDDTNNL